MEKINVAELLKDCPKGMELDCALFNNSVTLNKVADDDEFPITIETAKGDFVTLTKYGTYAETEEAKCIIFPKGKTTWEGFVPPVEFKDGDIVFSGFSLISIFKGIKDGYSGSLHSYVSVEKDGGFYIDKDCWTLVNIRLATEEEEAKLFQAIKDNGYKWNPKTKTLEKLPKFKVGDRIRHKCKKFRDERTVISYGKSGYWTSINDWIDYENQDNLELVPNKFDITTLVPFESRVLVRDNDHGEWRSSFWGHLRQKADMKYDTIRGVYKQCIPYEGNEHLLGKTDDCDEYFKTWK